MDNESVVSQREKAVDIVYFSMEIVLNGDFPTYSGGLGILAGDTLLTMADFGYKAIGVTLLNERGYYSSILNESWVKDSLLEKMPFNVTVSIEGRLVVCLVWRYKIVGQYGKSVDVYLLDSNAEQNCEYDRSITSYLYGGDVRYRLHQEQILGLGGFSLLESLGYDLEKIRIFHLNEGHPAFFGLAMYRWCRQHYLTDKNTLDFLSSRLVFTTHTPVAAGHDVFLRSLVSSSLAPEFFNFLPEQSYENDELNMTRLAMFYSGATTSVARKHQTVTRELIGSNGSVEEPVLTVTNGVHHLRWVHGALSELYSQYCPLWKRNPAFLRMVLQIPPSRFWQAHLKAKNDLLEYVSQVTEVKLDSQVLTLGFARRMTEYKRPFLILSRPDELRALSQEVGPIQIIFAGKAHAKDTSGRELINKIMDRKNDFGDQVKIIFLPNYDVGVASKLVAGVDVWVNTPLRPFEASGTSGMKAALNGVPHFSILDGWWGEGWVEGVTGWSIGSRLLDISEEDESDKAFDEGDLYFKLGSKIMPLYYKDIEGFTKVMLGAAAINGSMFTTHRMVTEYVSKIYFPLKNRQRFEEIG